MRGSDNDHIGRVFDKQAPRYDRSMRRWERFLGPGRRWAAENATGDVLELAVGTGLNLPYYPPTTHVLGVDLSEQMLAVARRRIDELEIGDRARVARGDVQALELPDASRDTVISTYTFCTIPDPHAAAREAFRVLRPGGRFLLVEHGRSTNTLLNGALHAVERLTVRFGADHLTRDPVPSLRDAGFRVDDVQRTKAGVVFRVAASKAAA